MKFNIHKYYQSILNGDIESIFTKRNNEVKDPVCDYKFNNYTKLLSLTTHDEISGIKRNETVEDSVVYETKPLTSPTISVFGKLELDATGFTADDVQCARKIRIYPTETEKSKINKLFSISNAFYNLAIEGIENKTININNKTDIRRKCRVNDDVCNTVHVDAKMAYFDTRSLAAMMAVSNHKAMLTNHQNGNIKHFKLSNKHSTQIVYFSPKDAKLRDDHLCIRDMKLRIRNRDLPWLVEQGINQQISIKRYNRKYYVVVPFKRRSLDNHAKGICAIDPGNRTFATYYSPDEIGKLGVNLIEKVRKINVKIDHLNYIKDTVKLVSRTRHGLKQRIAKLSDKITRLVDYAGWKFAAYLTRRFRVIFVPRLANVVKGGRNSTVNRETRNLRHSEFINKLTHLGKINGCKVVETKEYYTTKTCCRCGIRNDDVGSSKVFSCVNAACKFTIDRDVNGAKNIWLRSLTN
ncbi:putative transposase [Faustovirus]|nr:putative transposase [Faustovirus]